MTGSLPAGRWEAVRTAVAAVADPEIPVLTIEDLGVLRSIEQVGGQVVVTITPTYSGCPAMDHIEREVRDVLADLAVDGQVRTVLSPAWTTDWMSEAGRRKLRAFGIAPPDPPSPTSPPADRRHIGVPVVIARPVPCPSCGSVDTELISEFGSTACKALRRCVTCREPFDHFKELR